MHHQKMERAREEVVMLPWSRLHEDFMVMVYSIDHISGAHFNMAITFTIFRHFPPKHLPLYNAAHELGSILASGTLCLVLVGPNVRYLVMQIIASFVWMFVISGIATDSRAIGELAGIAVGMTITMDVPVARPVLGASMDPARSQGPAIVMHTDKGIWIYIVVAYNLIRFADKPLRELTDKTNTAGVKKSASFIKYVSKNNFYRT
ncbi:aquaporin NIP-type [Pyrus ussuriensis x Pyrus communis]|uniref:Aquaporin NIP-type n=1 Tax=Pyrus ussuriensis x Pyrus communis TaxID=2448454 RepID=A0A5N5GXF4_9ROSA|nr:aquaporin NIP-type [Pyrus ussuriensis x Pyrus communis]